MSNPPLDLSVIEAKEQSQCHQSLHDKTNSYAGLSFIDLVSVG
jgi:hypothetical protein